MTMLGESEVANGKVDHREVFEAAISLPARDRAALVELLRQSLDAEFSDDVRDAWAQEAERRVAAFDQGATRTSPAEDVFRRLQAMRSQS